MTQLVLTAVAVLLSALALGGAWAAWREAKATRGELTRHRWSHTQQREEDEPARRHGEKRGPPPPVDQHAAPATAQIPLLPPGRRPRVREDPQA